MEHQVLTGFYELRYKNKNGKLEIFIGKGSGLNQKIAELCKSGVLNIKLTRLTNLVIDNRMEGLNND